VSFAGGVVTATALRTGQSAPPPSAFGQIPAGNGHFVTVPPDARGIVVWTLRDGIAVTAKSFWVKTSPGPDGSLRNTVEEDAFAHPSAD
jgi:hypothetical protein